MGNFKEAFLLMVVGMTTVFTVLCLVILTGNILISLVNKYFPESQKTKDAVFQENSINPNVVKAIENAVSTITGGKGKVEKIEKI